MKKLLMTLLILFSLQMKSFANYNVVFTIDKNYWVYTMITIDSIIKNNSSNSPYTFWILETDIPDEIKAQMEKIIKDYGQEIKFVRVDTQKIDKGKTVYSKLKRVSNVGMIRILIPDILPETINNDVLYLDSDMLITTDLKNLFETELGNNYAGMILSPVKISTDLHDFKYGYANSGLLLFNMPKWRKDKMSEKILKYFHDNFDLFTCSNSQKDKCYQFADQDLLNIILEQKLKKLDKKWNNTVYRRSYNTLEKECIYHYNSNKKPWLFEYDPTYAKRLYLKYWAESPVSKYRYYFAIKRIYTLYFDKVEKRLKSYKTFFAKLLKQTTQKQNIDMNIEGEAGV